ncbi:MAG: hypothetical protein DPW09_29745 [Anaerolineae bacterium]|nr:hypothetical protein [Anaerolineales bacterium]MCQ3977631.1 hypothetical protein [Anaerolineae bacterium]
MLVLALGFVGGVAQAHGGGTPQLTNVRVGPYGVFVWTQPEPLRVGVVHLTVAVAEPLTPSAGQSVEAGPPVLNAAVQLELKPLDQPDQILIVPATHQAAVNKFFYEVDLDLPAAGQWEVKVLVNGPAGAGDARFEVEVLPPATFTGWFLGGGLAVVLLAFGWVIRRV